MFASIFNKVAKALRALGTIRFSQLLLPPLHLIHGAKEQQASEKETVEKLA